jgi:hypothetical protein
MLDAEAQARRAGEEDSSESSQGPRAQSKFSKFLARGTAEDDALKPLVDFDLIPLPPPPQAEHAGANWNTVQHTPPRFPPQERKSLAAHDSRAPERPREGKDGAFSISTMLAELQFLEAQISQEEDRAPHNPAQRASPLFCSDEEQRSFEQARRMSTSSSQDSSDYVDLVDLLKIAKKCPPPLSPEIIASAPGEIPTEMQLKSSLSLEKSPAGRACSSSGSPSCTKRINRSRGPSPVRGGVCSPTPPRTPKVLVCTPRRDLQGLLCSPLFKPEPSPSASASHSPKILQVHPVSFNMPKFPEYDNEEPAKDDSEGCADAGFQPPGSPVSFRRPLMDAPAMPVFHIGKCPPPRPMHDMNPVLCTGHLQLDRRRVLFSARTHVRTCLNRRCLLPQQTGSVYVAHAIISSNGLAALQESTKA